MMEKNNVWVVHRGAGKTYLIQHILIQSCMDASKVGAYLYICPELKQARRNLWDGLKRYLQPLLDMTDERGKPLNLVRINEQYSTVEFWTGSKLYVLGADDPENLRGVHPLGYVVDETQGISDEALAVLEGAASNDPWRIFIGTPKSHNILYRLFMGNTGKPNWFTIKLDAHQAKRLPQEKIEDRRQFYLGLHGNDAFFRQEYLCDFDAAVSGAYYASLMQRVIDDGRIREVMYDPTYPVHTAWDLGKDCTAVWFFQVVNEQIRVIDYLAMYNNNGLPEVISHVKAKGYAFGTHIGPHDVNQTMATGQTKGDVAALHGILFDVIDPKLSKDDGIDAVRRLLPRCVFDERKCADGIESLKQYSPRVNKEGVIIDAKHDKYSHGADAFRYLAVNINEVCNSTMQARTPETLWKPQREEWSFW